MLRLSLRTESVNVLCLSLRTESCKCAVFVLEDCKSKCAVFVLEDWDREDAIFLYEIFFCVTTQKICCFLKHDAVCSGRILPDLQRNLLKGKWSGRLRERQSESQEISHVL